MKPKEERVKTVTGEKGWLIQGKQADLTAGVGRCGGRRHIAALFPGSCPS